MNTAIHSGTPNLAATDPRGLPIRQVAYLRKKAGDAVESLISRQLHNPAGQMTEQWDPRLSIPCLSNVYRLSGEAISINSVDAGKRLILPGLAGEELRRWDPRGNHWRTRYDGQLRVVAVDENDQQNVETFRYADATGDPTLNQRGQMVALVDRSGRLDLSSFSLQGQPQLETRTIVEADAHSTSRTFSPLNVVLTQTNAGGHRQQLLYDIAGHLKQVFLQLNGGERQCVLADAQYDAAGKIVQQTAGNGVLSQWSYDPADGRLCTLKAGKPDEALRQNLHYFYDRMGNILRIEDHALATVHFANQCVEGHRNFGYDSLYRLTSASGFEGEIPHDRPGLPDVITPLDPGPCFNYTERYIYDTSNNLKELHHVRDNHCFTRRMIIDPASNRGVRQEEDQPEPDFETLFDPGGNQLYLQRHQPLHWNARDQLEKVTLVIHDNELSDDVETYHYSQGERIRKHHVTHTPSVTHSHTVLYLPDLEIRTRSNGEQLHVITLPLAYGSVRCLHWVTHEHPDQLRYSLDDHLGSCVLELDHLGGLISHEVYYPFGGTAWWAARSALEASFKTIRYSGKEMDVTGLYYFGLRYYAPWLWRWVSPDPEGNVDGPNLYVMVGNNPLLYTDKSGARKRVVELAKGFVGVLDKAKNAADQIQNLATEFDGLVPEGADIAEVRESMTLGKFLKSKYGLKSIFTGIAAGSTVASVMGTVVPGVGTAIGAAVGMVVGAIAMPLLRYYFFKKSLKLAETLHTQEIRDGLSTAADTTKKVVDGAHDLVSGAGDVLEKIKNGMAAINSYPERMQNVFYKQLEELASPSQREVMALINTGIEPFEAITKVLELAKAAADLPSEAEGVTQRLTELAQEVVETVVERPVPKPRKLIQKMHRAVSESAA
ncbi:RHS repeat-associated core domain-containing protein [Pseudomonas sp. MDT2-39-1]